MTADKKLLEQQQQQQEEQMRQEELDRIPRELGGSYTSPYFVDKNGNEYESYAMAWRYLGVYMDCGGSSRQRTLSWYSNYKQRKACYPKLLWAAYHDPNYNGGSIGEYQFYDWQYNKWDQSTCKTNRCAKMDCHSADTDWELIGVYKESVEFDKDTFFEQLFKHEGYCLWDGDKESYNTDNSNYQFMQSMRSEMPDGCTLLENIKTYSGSSYYVGVKPLSEGNITLGIYTDAYCQTESYYTFQDYQKFVSGTTSSSGAFDRWNTLMNSYKVCQPCRAYNRVKTYESSRRHLVEYNDGKGDEEQWGYNCYDDADYRNCNQCFKFETHTDMAVASASDLAVASTQGTIMAIQYLDGAWYGSGVIGPTAAPAPTPTDNPNSSENSASAYSGSNRYRSSSSSGYNSGYNNGYSNGYNNRYNSSSGSYYSSQYRYSFAGGAVLVVCAVALGLCKAFRRPRIVISGAVTDESQPPATLLSTLS